MIWVRLKEDFEQNFNLSPTYYTCSVTNNEQHNFPCVSKRQAKRIYNSIDTYQVKWWENSKKCEIYNKVSIPYE